MKIRWRIHELLLAILITLTAIAGYVKDGIDHKSPVSQESFRAGFAGEGRSFNYNENILFPQIVLVLVFFAVYACMRFLVFRKSAGILFNTQPAGKKTFAFLLMVSGLMLAAWLLAVGANYVTHLARPYLYSYQSFSFLSLFGYNSAPLTDLFFGFRSALSLVLIFGVYMLLSEWIINKVEKSGDGRSYGKLIINQITMTAVGFLFFPVLLRSFGVVDMESGFWRNYIGLVPPVICTYLVATYWLFPVRGPQFFRHIPSLLIILGVTFAATIFFTGLLGRKSFSFVLAYWLIQTLVITILSWFIFQQWKDKILQLRGAEKALARTTTDLQFLRSQINPHFLFNSLNTLYSTSLQENADNTAEGIQKLGDMMRYMLHDNNQDHILLSREMEYLENYIELQKLRIKNSSSIRISQHIQCAHPEHKIVPMLLIPVIENAFKHGISLTEESWIDIQLTCEPTAVNLVVRNSIHTNRKGEQNPEHSGVGLSNVEKRLALLYNGKHRFNYGSEGNEFVVNLNIVVA